MKYLILPTLLLLIFSCSKAQKTRHERDNEFYAQARRAKMEMPKENYRRWLNKMLVAKQSQFKGYQSYQNAETRKLHQHEDMSRGATQVGGHQDVHQFKAQRSGIQIKRWEEEKKVIEKQIFYLKSQLSALESGI